jgi:large subunit ribosomal protein L35
VAILLTPSVLRNPEGDCVSPQRIPLGDTDMPKIKTNRSAAKRFKKTGTGNFTYHKSFGSHILSTKSRKRKRSLRKSPLVDSTNLKAVKLLLPNG